MKHISDDTTSGCIDNSFTLYIVLSLMDVTITWTAIMDKFELEYENEIFTGST